MSDFLNDSSRKTLSSLRDEDIDASHGLPEEHPYKALLKEANEDDSSDLDRLKCVVVGRSCDGIPTIFFSPRLGFGNDISISQSQKDRALKRLMLHFIKIANSIVTGRYILVYAHTPLTILSQQPLIYKYYKILPREYKKNMMHLYIMYPNFLMRGFFEVGVRWFISDKFYKKLHFIYSIAELQKAIGSQGLEVPHLFVDNEDVENSFMTEKAIDAVKKDKKNALRERINKCAPLAESFDDEFGCTRLIDRCCHFLRQSSEGLKKHSIFRISGNGVTLGVVKRRLMSGNIEHLKCVAIGADDPLLTADVNQSTASDKSAGGGPSRKESFTPATVIVNDIDTVANILKVCIRYLPEPLIPLDEYHILSEAMLHYSTEDEADVNAWRSVVTSSLDSMPYEHSKLLTYILNFLSEVALEADTSTMDADNLARIFSPTFFQTFIDTTTESDPMKVFNEVNKGGKLLKKLINDHSTHKEEGLRRRIATSQGMLDRMKAHESQQFRNRGLAEEEQGSGDESESSSESDDSKSGEER